MKDWEMAAPQPWQDRLNLVLGAWLVLAPFLGVGAMHDAAAWNAYISGGLVVISAVWALAWPQLWAEWLNLALGLWLVAAPFSLGFQTQTAPTWNQILVGLVVGIGAGWALAQRRMHMPPHHPA